MTEAIDQPDVALGDRTNMAFMSTPVTRGRGELIVTVTGMSTEIGHIAELLNSGGAKIDLDAVMLPMALCADPRLDGENLIGDPTEGALIVLAEKGGIDVDGAREMFPRVAEVPFDSDYKFMATFHEMTDDQGRPVVRCLLKGAPDRGLRHGLLAERFGDPLTQ